MEEPGMKREQKIQEILFEGKQNDLSPSIEWLAKGLSNSWVEYSPQKSDFESLYAQASKNSSKILSFSDFTKNKLIWGISAAAIFLFAVTLGYYSILKDKPSLGVEKGGVEISQVEGEAYLTSSDPKDKILLKPGVRIQEGQRVVTGSKAILNLKVSDGIVVRVLSDSEVSFRLIDLSTHYKIGIDLEKGELLAHIHKNLKKEEFIVRSENLSAEVRGTSFSFQNIPGQGTKVEVLEGRVAVSTHVESQKSAPEGEQVIEPNQGIFVNQKGFVRSHLNDFEKNRLETEFEKLPIENIPRDKNRTYSNRQELLTDFQRLEKIILINGKEIEGVIVDMDEKAMYIQTLEKEIVIQRESVSEVIQLY
ncbi:FecR family protein [Leptospira interrogans]|uniref:LipL45-related protein n=14 Tax=Leptospira interrogans TaxID=173 RepID=Q8EXR5_LEPIN|nr:MULTISPECIES: FecR family protein [Leptospira]EMF74278.1 sigma factor regulatory protein, FecR/PupR family [Leptospira interrogans serovar Canicola str. LT1962]EMM82303.1 sigma factor regulatory protein, FecR/PupR family [Leptospira interrogans str. 2006001854]EMM94103.1 sigma factor regulatory protein, FecR/PupR family [Leptospira interrogans serovar Zanoni str. LT2156]EMN49864.1 sigma factor regulatory protein, FecR/PupR family [Leptospira interrogans str. L1207]AAN51702.1 LipL45-related 